MLLTLVALAGLVTGGLILQAMRLPDRHVLGPLAGTAEVTSAMAAGDLTAGRRAEHRDDEIGEMTRAIKVFRSAAEAQRADAEKQAHVVRATGSALGQLAVGDLAHRVEARFSGGYGSIRRAYNAAADRLDKVLSRVAGSVESVNSGAGEIRAASSNLAERNQMQAASVEGSITAIRQVSMLVWATASRNHKAQAKIRFAAQDAAADSTLVG